ncbi:DNA-binding MarR family transcriptional regulator [Dysgonomonas hofstadii]|uniref:HTH-type transcriptional regulator SarZ n=1 Tax=Dysgonomonas hofstadii TaxID=637886 RepID=A0A840CVF0_9BACT|nr:MarR family transcriptional regulator [Dysgonomonas hofstadii]MBB4035773.1 DNA-binding MarR family transcriptional regulator [Dysgonomonas hofstadii]
MEKIRENSMKGVNVDSLMRHVFKLWMRSKKQILDEFRLTGSQYEILSAIYHLNTYKKEIIQIDLSEETGIDPMTVSTILRNLEKNNMITRVRGTVNTRVIYIELTDKGKSLYSMASSKMLLCCNNLYRNIDERNFTAQLLVLSKELNKLNN